MAMKLSSRWLFWLTSALSLVAMAVALLHPNPAVAADRVYLSKLDSQIALLGKGTLSTNPRSGMVSHLVGRAARESTAWQRREALWRPYQECLHESDKYGRSDYLPWTNV
jgi:hypothetical protein